MIDDVTGGPDEPKRPVVSRRRGLGKGLGAILPSRDRADEEKARRDQLTGLPDRSVLEERFEEAMARCREDGASLAVLVVALDGFGDVNELYGHNVGDELLHDAAARLSAARRKFDTVARFAGDEFVLVCPYVASTDLASQLASRILEELSRPTAVDGVEHQLSASIGVVVTSPRDAPSGGTSFETLLGDASLAMRRAKGDGGASWKLFDPSMREHVEVRSQSRRDLRTALEEDDLMLEYEAIVDLETGVSVGEAAILGWRQPGPDVDQPQAPLDLVDEAGLAVPIGRWVLDTALAAVSARSAQPGLAEGFRMWVKVAPSLVADPVLVEIVDELTAQHGVSPSVLGLDIREPSAAALASTETTLRALEDRDVLVALDDFGAGPSNLALVQRLPITGLKLAPDLVAALGDEQGDGDAEPSDADVGPDPVPPPHPATASVDSAERADALSREAAALVRGLIELGRALELTVVAQGVESLDQATELHALGCRYVQGPYLLLDDAAPAPGDTPEPSSEVPGDGDGGSAQSSSEQPSAVPDRAVPESESLWAPGTLTTGFELPGSSAQES